MNRPKFLVACLIVCLLVGGGIYARYHSSHAPDAPPLKIGILYYPGFGPFYIAQDKGWFKEAGVNVELVELPADQLIPALGSNQIQILLSSVDLLPIVADAGISAKGIFVTSLSNGADALLTTTDIQRLDQLKGKTVHVPLGFPGHYLLRAAAKEVGLTRDDISLVNLSAEDIGAAFVAGKIESGLTWEPWVSRAAERPNGHILLSSKDLPGIITDTAIARTDAITQHEKDLQTIASVALKTAAWWETHPEEGDQIVAKAFQIPPEQMKQIRQTVRLGTIELNREKIDQTKTRNVYELIDQAGQIFLDDGLIHTTTTRMNLFDPSIVLDMLHE